MTNMTDDLHAEVERLLPLEDTRRSPHRMIIHALIDLGLITVLECQYDRCVLSSAEFGVHGKNVRGQRDALTIDHIINLSQGGTDRPENLQLVHWACNVAKGTRDANSDPELKQRHSDGMSRRWREDADYRERMSKRVVSDEERQKRSESMKRHWADPDKRAAHSASLARGDDWHAAREVNDDVGDN